MTAPIGQFVDTTQGRSSTNPFITLIQNRPPTGNDGINNKLQVGQRWIDTSNANNEWFLLNFISSNGVVQANWVALGGSIAAETLTGNSGGPVFPDGSSNINVVGDGVGITITGNPGSHTLTASLVGGGSALETLSDDVGTSITPLANNIQLVGHVVEQGATKFSTVVAGTHLANINPMSCARWIVDPLGFNGTHLTISSAIASATSGDTIFILPGTYTENPTLKAGVNLSANLCDAYTPSVIIIGKCSASFAGSVSISGIQLQTNGDYCLSITGSVATDVELINCYIYAANHTAINNSSSSTSRLDLHYCTGNIGATGISYFNLTGGLTKLFGGDYENNIASSTTASMVGNGGDLEFYAVEYFNPGVTTSGTGIFHACSSNIVGAITIGDTSTNSYFTLCQIVSGSSPAITISAGSLATVLKCAINSTATNALTGLGSLVHGDNTYSNSYGINVSTIKNVSLPYASGSLTVSPFPALGQYQSISAALGVAVSGQTIFVKPGTYTENPTLVAGVNLCANTTDGVSGNVTIIGKCTFSSAGTVAISGINFQTNSDFAIAFTGSSVSTLYLTNCYLNCLNHTGISFTNSNTSSNLFTYQLNANVATTGISLFTISSAGGFLYFYQANCTNSGNSTTPSTCTGTGAPLFLGCNFYIPITDSGTYGTRIYNCWFNTSLINTFALTYSGSGGAKVANSVIYSGTASAVVVNSPGAVSLTNTTLESSNTNVVTGTGTIGIGGCVCTSSSGNNVSTIINYTVI